MKFTITANINKDIMTCWHTYHIPEHIMNWNYASDDWHTTSAKSDFQVGGHFSYIMEAKDKSVGFDFSGVFTEIDEPNLIIYRLDDQREVAIKFLQQENDTYVEVVIDAEEENSVAIQKRGWQAILNHFKSYVEKLK
jgi:uncharacterized protein YndB with AHSA1/START domain